MSKPFQSCLNPFKHAKNIENHVLKSKNIKKCVNFKKSFGWKPYGGKSGSRKTMVIFSRPDFKVFSTEFTEKVNFTTLPEASHPSQPLALL